MKRRVSRREFIMSTAAAAGAAAGGFTILGATAKGAGTTFKVGLIGCGGRGNGALAQHVAAGKALDLVIQVVATADYFQDRAERTGQKHGVPKARCFGGIQAYQKLLDTDVEIVLMAQTPLFRPRHFTAAVKAGKHVFMEKPAAVDPAGCRAVIAAAKEADDKRLVVVAGTNLRHEKDYILTHQAVAKEEALGKLYAGRVACCLHHHFWRQPTQAKSADDLVRTWQSWIQLSGDHIVEQHVHNLDIANWFVGRVPVSAAGMGGRARRPAGNIYDFFSIDFDYGDGVHIHSMCRQIDGCWKWFGHDFVYGKGRTNGADHPEPKDSPIPADMPQLRGGHTQEHVHLLYALTRGHKLNQARTVAEATAAAVLGRNVAYGGQRFFWRDMMENPDREPALYHQRFRPTAEDFEKGEVPMPKEGVHPHPGRRPAPAARPGPPGSGGPPRS